MLSKTKRIVPLLGAALATVTVATVPALASPVSDSVSARAAASPTRFTMSSLNVLGASHTRHSHQYASGVHRARGVVKLLKKHHVDVVGFQEMQRDQMRRFVKLSNGRYHLFPGRRRSEIDGENSIAWSAKAFSLVKAKTVEIPYFNGRKREMPVVKLRSKATGTTAWFANFHNPATNSNTGRQGRSRMKAIHDEVRLANKLHRSSRPVFITGDMNERKKVFCPMTGKAPMHAARGGSNRHGHCRPDDPWYVDWIFGSKHVSFSHYTEDLSKLVRRTTDHPMIISHVRLAPR
jgi:mRNA deadenylase 3'-5' endonuclease subunit Ccr4